jgi:hypothetical protein
MRIFINKSVFFILPLLIMLVCMEVLLRSIPNDYSYKKNYLDTNSNNIEILCLGSSHAYYGINPVYFGKKSFNASHKSQLLDYDLKIFRKYQDRLNSLKYILIPISYFSLYSKLDKGIESWHVKDYVLYYDMSSSNIKDYSEVLSMNSGTNVKRIISFYIMKKQPITCSELGYGLDYASNNQQDLIKTGVTAAKRHTINNDTFFNENLVNLKAIIELAKKNKVKIIFYTPPAYYTYRNNLSTDQLERSINAIRKMRREYENIFYINYMNDERFVKSDFYDADHLNEIGAEKLTKMLDTLIRDQAEHP